MPSYESCIGEIQLWAPNFAPRDWAFCWGQTMSIAQNTALFSLIGTTYGGDGRVTFQLPDLRGRFPIGTGPRPGLTNYPLGQTGGAAQTTFSVTDLPAFTDPPAQTVLAAPGGVPSIPTMPPYLAVNYIICLYGYYPTRS